MLTVVGMTLYLIFKFMNKFKFTRESGRIFELSHQLNDTELSEDEGKELNKLLKNNPEGQLIFLSLRDQDLSLSERLQNRSIHEKTLGESEPKETPKAKSKPDAKADDTAKAG